MKNKTIVIACFLLLMLSLGTGKGFGATRQPLKALLVICDDYRSAENNEIAPSVRVDKLHVTRFIDKLRKQNIVQPQVTIIEGEDASKANVTQALQDLRVAPNDILLFYFSGHGGRDKQGKTTLWFTDEKQMLRSTLQRMIEAKQARFSLLITDACTESLNQIGGIRNFTGKPKPMSDEKFTRNYRHLLLEYRGLLHWSSSSEGEFSFGGGNGGIFTESLFRDTLSHNPTGGWDKIFTRVKKQTAYKFDRMMKVDEYKTSKKSPKKSILKFFDDIFTSDDDEYEMSQDSQTPKAFSMPIPLTATNTPPANNETRLDTEPIKEPEQETEEDTEDETEDETEADEPVRNETGATAATIYNETGKTITFFMYLNNAAHQPGWNKTKSKKYTLKAGDEVTIRQTGAIVVFYDTGNGQTDYAELAGGDYGFFKENGGVVLDYAEVEDNEAQEDTEEKTLENTGGNWEKKK